MSAKPKSDKRKPGPDPERLVIEGDPGAALDKLLGKRSGPLRPQELSDFDPHASYEPGVYEAIIATGSTREPLPYVVHHTRLRDWCIRGGAPEPKKNILRVRWISELPE